MLSVYFCRDYPLYSFFSIEKNWKIQGSYARKYTAKSYIKVKTAFSKNLKAGKKSARIWFTPKILKIEMGYI